MEPTIIPSQERGKQNDLSEERSCNSQDEAARCFEQVKYRLLHPAEWRRLAGATSAVFELFSADGQQLTRSAEKGDLVRIDLPGPGTRSGDGYDWVRVDDTEEKTDAHTGSSLFGLRLVACPAPDADTNASSHFFKAGASSTFVLVRNGEKVTLHYHGRNETPNTDTGNLVDNVRNGVTGVLAMSGLSEMQWSALLKGLLADTTENR